MNAIRINYPDGSRKHVKAAERDDMLLSRLIVCVGPKEYRYIGQDKTFQNFVDWGKWYATRKPASGPLRRFLQGSFVIEDSDGRRYEERLETPESLEMNLPARIAQLEAVGA